MHIVLIALVMDFSGLVLAEAVLSYVGIGVDPSTISFGTMINMARAELARGADGLVVVGRGLRVHVRARAGGQPVRRRGARRLRPAPRLGAPSPASAGPTMKDSPMRRFASTTASCAGCPPIPEPDNRPPGPWRVLLARDAHAGKGAAPAGVVARVAEILGVDGADVRNAEFARVFGGNGLLPGMEPTPRATAATSSATGRGNSATGARSLGESINARGEHGELH